jgi:hypothetical protein
VIGMTRIARPRVGLALVLPLAFARQLSAQWIVTARLGSAHYWGGSIETSPPHRSFRPYQPTTVGAGVSRQGGRLHLGLRVSYSGSSLGLEGGDAVVSAKGVIDTYGAAAEVGVGLARLAGGARLLLSAGPLLELWKLADDVSRVRGGVTAGLSLELPLAPRLAAEIEAGGAVLPSSPFSRDALVDGFVPKPLWRRELSLGVGYRL